MNNAVSSMGHFGVWLAEFAVAVFCASLTMMLDSGQMEDATEVIVFFLPCVNFVLYPFIQVASSELLRRQVQKMASCK